MIFSRLVQRHFGFDLTRASGRALTEQQYWSVRGQTPIVYLLCIVNFSVIEIAATGRLSLGWNAPSFITACGVIRLWQWYGDGSGAAPAHEIMPKRLRQVVWFAAIICIVACARCLYLLEVGDATSRMAVMLLGGLTAIGVGCALSALPIARLMPLILIIVPMSFAALISNDQRLVGAALGLAVVAILNLRTSGARGAQFSAAIGSRPVIEGEQELIERARQEAIIAATTDFLTGLPNRRALVAALEMAASEGITPFALAILDLDHFKTINDTFGHAIGDQLLKEVAARLVSTVGRRGLVARLGGDEFGVLLPGARSAKEAQAIGSDILRRVNGPARLNDREFTIAASCGIGLARKCEDSSPSRLLADADLALYQAKESPGGDAAIFELRMEAPRRRRALIERALRLPGARDRLRVVFQPIFDLKTGRIIANEALARWSDPELGAISPSEFVPIAEDLHLIDDINSHLMALAFEAARSWPQDIKLSFNLSAIQLRSAGVAKSVLEALEHANLAATRLQVEVTETALLADFEQARSNLTDLRKAGAMIVLDDFGAGYASIGYLRELKFDQIKLDGALVTAALHSADGKRLLRAVIGLCEILGVSSVAEHVESKDLLRLVIELGCGAGQGFWLERPLEPEDVLHLFGSKVIPLRMRNRRAA